MTKSQAEISHELTEVLGEVYLCQNESDTQSVVSGLAKRGLRIVPIADYVEIVFEAAENTTPLPSAGRPATPCTREELSQLAKAANLRLTLVGVWKNVNSLGGLTTDDPMRFADAARGVK